ncbi:hypothetical protein STSP2_00393 [Anaerohalosphaera lusitana]|uniref:Uncharacterized protein n=1 Tax=Anaerohalosphaera lusitana TaxID=1936003 RepID=A0A1U9NI16_9BACT|nr:hypothetical protein STSP2_00393 [Anaerohalosphaera lusitana]
MAEAIRDLKEDHVITNKARLDCILNLIALFHVRHPLVRRNIAKTQANLAKMTMQLICASKERYEETLRRMQMDGIEIGDVSFEQMKDFLERDEYDIETARESHIEMELKAIGPVLEMLGARNWTLLIASDTASQFITSDLPVTVSWNDPENIPPFVRQRPGLGYAETEVFFPITRTLALLGTFEPVKEQISLDRNSIAVLNSKTLCNAWSQVYAGDNKFEFIDHTGRIITGNQLLDWLNIREQ